MFKLILSGSCCNAPSLHPGGGGGGVGALRDDTKLVNDFACLGGYIGDYVFILDLLFVQTICPSSSVETANIKKKKL